MEVHGTSEDGEKRVQSREVQFCQENCSGSVSIQTSLTLRRFDLKFLLVVPSSEGHELTIWDSMESEFASGLEYCGVFEYVMISLATDNKLTLRRI